MPRQKKPRGRPARPLPPRVDATPDELAELFMRTPPPGPKVDIERVYRCVDCQRVVEWPEILYRNGKCEQCNKTPV